MLKKLRIKIDRNDLDVSEIVTKSKRKIVAICRLHVMLVLRVI